MEDNSKSIYQTPTTTIVDVQIEAIMITASKKGYDNAFEI